MGLGERGMISVLLTTQSLCSKLPKVSQRSALVCYAAWMPISKNVFGKFRQKCYGSRCHHLGNSTTSKLTGPSQHIPHTSNPNSQSPIPKTHFTPHTQNQTNASQHHKRHSRTHSPQTRNTNTNVQKADQQQAQREGKRLPYE